MAIINQLTRQQQAQQNPFIGLPPEQLDAIIAEAKTNLTKQRGQGIKQGIGNVLGTAGDIFMQMGGLKPVGRQQQTQRGDTLDEWVMKERIKQAMRNNPEAVIDTTGEVVDPGPAKMKPVYGLDKSTNEMKLIGEIPTGATIQDITPKPKEKSVAQQNLELKKSEDERRKKEASIRTVEAAQDSLDAIAEVEKGINYFGAGALIPGIPTLQPEKIKWEANLNKLMAEKILNVMNTMKSASRTGATGFGQLNRSELKILQDAATALKKTMSPQDAQEILDVMKEKLRKIVGDNLTGDIITDTKNDREKSQTGQGIMTATNPQTGEQIISTDGGQSWQPK